MRPEEHSPGRVPGSDLLHELVQLLSVLPHFPGEILRDVNPQALQQLGFPQHVLFVVVVSKVDLVVDWSAWDHQFV